MREFFQQCSEQPGLAQKSFQSDRTSSTRFVSKELTLHNAESKIKSNVIF